MKRLFILIFLFSVSSAYSLSVDYEAGAGLSWPRMFRGLDVTGADTLSLSPFARAEIDEWNLKFFLEAQTALTERGTSFDTGSFDELRLSGLWKDFVIKDLFEVGGGASVYYYPFSAINHFEFELLASFSYPMEIFTPEINLVYNFSQYQTGFYWGLDLRRDFPLWISELQVDLETYYASGYMSMEGGRFFQHLFQGNWEDMFEFAQPCHVTLTAAYPMDFGSWRVTPAAFFNWAIRWNWNEDRVQAGGSLTVSRLWGDTDYRLNELK